MTKMPDEIKDAILQGLINLMALRLRGSPAADTVSATATAWIMALSAKPVQWDVKLDLARVQKAFVILMGGTETWPTPIAFFERMPPREPQRKIEHKTAGGMSPATRALIDGCKKRLRASTANQEEGDNAE